MSDGACTPHPDALLDANSVSWRLHNPLRFLGMGREVLMQLAEPRIAAAVASTGDFEADPAGRTVRTIGVFAAIRFGSPDERQTMLDRLKRVHEPIGGVWEGKPFHASDPELQFWVLATAIDAALEIDRRFVGSLSNVDQACYYDEQRAIAQLLGLPDTIVPPDLRAFTAWLAWKIETLEVTPDARRLAGALLDSPMLPLRGLATPLLRNITTELMPDRLRAAFGLRSPAPLSHTTFQVGRSVMRLPCRYLTRHKGRLPGHPGMRLERRLLQSVATASHPT